MVISTVPLLRVLLLSGFAQLGLRPLVRAQETDHAWADPVRAERWKLYRPIEDDRTRQNVDYALTRAYRQLGPARVPVQTLHLCFSVPVNEGNSLERNFNATMLNDEPSGTFTITVMPREGENLVQFKALYHEVGHLLNARLLDVYVEGLNDAFAKRHFRHMGWDWERFKAWTDADDVYGWSLKMMDEVWRVAGAADMRRFLSYAVPTEDRPPWMHIDVNAWLASLRPAKRAKVAAIMLRYAPTLEPKRLNSYGVDLSFEWPRPEMTRLDSRAP